MEDELKTKDDEEKTKAQHLDNISNNLQRVINLVAVKTELYDSVVDTDSDLDKTSDDNSCTENQLSSAEYNFDHKKNHSKKHRPLELTSCQNVDPPNQPNTKLAPSEPQRKTIRIVGSRKLDPAPSGIIPNRRQDCKLGSENNNGHKIIGIKYEIEDIGELAGKERKYKCNFCNKTFLKLSNLNRHEHIHTGIKPYNCCECGKRFSRPCTLMVHMRSHTGEKPYTCKKCKKQFTTSCKLTVHNRIHTGERPYSCPECGRKFTESSALISHRRTHSGERPFECDECGKTFAHTSSLVKHFSTHIKKKQRVCNLCFNKFADQKEFDSHRQRIGEWKCEQCPKVFYSKCSLGQHCQKHLRDKFKCERCDEKFLSSSSLAQHMSKHSVTWGDFAF